METKINDKLIAFDGNIGRRSYILNMMYICIISSILTLPYTYWFSSEVTNIDFIFNPGAIIATAPIFVKFFYILSCIICGIISFGLDVRRLYDIWGKPLQYQAYALAGFLILSAMLWVFVTTPFTVLLFIIATIIGIILMCAPGKISGQIPHDPIKKFNWGAFWGTWIWGLFNKTYITMWALPLFFTPAGIYYAIICGMRGNEWAFLNTNALDSKSFLEKQKRQSIFWNTLAGFMIIVLPILLTFFIATAVVNLAIKNPEKVEATIEKMENLLEDIVLEQFENYEINVDENRFYMDPRNWVGLSYEDRYNLLKGAATVAASEKRKNKENKYPQYSGSQSRELPITKIYSTYNGELLAAYNVDYNDVTDIKSAFKAAMKALYFNVKPELPPVPTVEKN